MGLAEYGHIMGASALITTLYFGGWRLPFVPGDQMNIPVLITVGVFFLKMLFFCWVFIWIRWTLPRFRYDQLMHLGWKRLLPLSMANLLILAYLMKG
jgi:NADH-quinone oxidoreductase subunit H